MRELTHLFPLDKNKTRQDRKGFLGRFSPHFGSSFSTSDFVQKGFKLEHGPCPPVGEISTQHNAPETLGDSPIHFL